MNGISSHVFDFDDTHLRTVIHPAGPVASALLAFAEYRPVSGVDFVTAFVLGVEVECRIGLAVFPEHYDVGWHITGTTGVFGAWYDDEEFPSGSGGAERLHRRAASRARLYQLRAGYRGQAWLG